MAENATDILSVAAAKFALRIEDAPGIDEEIARHIGAAVDFCAEIAAKPLVDRTETFLAPRPASASGTVRLPSIYVKSITTVQYWETTQKLREDPTGEVMVAASDPPDDADDPIGRREVVERHYTAVWPPASGWPEVLSENGVESGFLFTYVEGIKDPLPGLLGISEAVALMTNVYHEGASEKEYTDAVRTLLQPFVDARWQI